MAILTPSPSVPLVFPQGPTYEDFSGLSHRQNGQSSIGPSPQLTNGNSLLRLRTSAEAGRNVAPGKQRLINDHPAGDLATASTVSPPHDISPEHLELIRTRTAEPSLTHRSRPQISRTNTDLGPGAARRSHVVEEAGELRHGWEDQYNSSEFLGLLSSVSH